MATSPLLPRLTSLTHQLRTPADSPRAVQSAGRAVLGPGSSRARQPSTTTPAGPPCCRNSARHRLCLSSVVKVAEEPYGDDGPMTDQPQPLAPAPSATYRVQFGPGFTFDDAAAVADYLARLGISHVY